ncbi:MAG: hypothetical protein ACREPB_07740 [Arenimonas sp.]
MTKITYIYPHDGLTVKAVHAYHQETLFFGLLFPVIEQQASQESLDEIFGSIAEDWAKQELGVLGFVSTYHMWERQLQELFLEQKERSDLTIPTLPSHENIVQYGKRVLLNTFEASAPEEYWLELDRARMVVNAFKHGPSKKFDAAMKAHPDFFFVPEDNSHLPIVSISMDQLRLLIKTVAAFWGELPRQIDYVRNSV